MRRFNSDKIADIVAKGAETYARAAYFEAHEIFEHAWRESGSPRSLELHALTQVAAALHKDTAHRKRDAARAIMLRAGAKLESVRTTCCAIDLVALRQTIDAWLADPERAPPTIATLTAENRD
jgi:hypothetical protein